jgi:nucleoside-triphosphatase THEP1
MIYIYTGKIHSGKTTSIINWINKNKNVAGVLTPVINGKRYFVFYPSRRKYLVEANDKSKQEIIPCGNYKFRKIIFDKANEYLKKGINENYEWVVIDEAGFLELDNSGFHTSIEDAVQKSSLKSAKTNLIIIVRDTLVESVLKKYKIEKTAKVINEISELEIIS